MYVQQQIQRSCLQKKKLKIAPTALLTIAGNASAVMTLECIYQPV